MKRITNVGWIGGKRFKWRWLALYKVPCILDLVTDHFDEDAAKGLFLSTNRPIGEYFITIQLGFVRREVEKT